MARYVSDLNNFIVGELFFGEMTEGDAERGRVDDADGVVIWDLLCLGLLCLGLLCFRGQG